MVVSLFNIFISDVLIKVVEFFKQTLLDFTPDLIVHGVQIWTVGRPQQ